jgi:hypothetical protein
MAKFEIKFIDAYETKDFIQCNAISPLGEHVIGFDISSQGQQCFIILDKSTAIKFAKTLRTEINKITEREVQNG